MRIGGLASGMDTQQMITDLMKAERMPLDKLIQRRTTLEWQRDAYRDINLQITNLRDSFRATGLGLQATFLQKSVNSSNQSVVRATATANAPNTSVQMNVQRLATASTYVSQNTLSAEVQDLELKDWNVPGLTFENGVANFEMTVKDPSTGESRVASFQLKETDKLSNVLTTLNSSSLGFNAYMDQNAAADSPQIVLNMRNTGANSDINFDQVGEEGDSTKLNNGLALFQSLGFTTVSPTEEGETSTTLSLEGGRPGTNARFTLNGHTTERTTNQFTINGVNYSLTGVSSSPDEITMITTQTNTDKIFEDIMKFVEQYNELVDKINGSVNEPRHRDFPPLTDEQRREMTEYEVEMWEEKAKSGLLRGDSALNSALSQMRSAMFSVVGVQGDLIRDLSQIGLVSSPNYMDGGKIVLDHTAREMPNGERMTGEDRLRYYIENHGEELYGFFMGDGPEASDKGILRKLRPALEGAMDRITSRAGREGRTNHQFTLGRELINVEDRITNFERRLQQTEQRYWNQFTAMETAMAQMNSQAEQMWAMVSGMMGN
ncbi:flagellar hook-associated protein 2 [Evansella cellulosilytica]|uniref:Flagellar hook-associated protein 2 n=1 Tax=Evansella cellulosilytica (strain ATCC 21833 / DSM 2522 / FERM P-1141 / JCM 9156 / N-4) TaxID=649639 RepID=E6TS73_EVAC2|nr:flagellar hook-associated protein 2 [Evansella cellulosilytica]ADU31842.1 flagellar hook-associated 2 domain-containing protein [Evansella cellulosilytica DSM 2522]